MPPSRAAPSRARSWCARRRAADGPARRDGGRWLLHRGGCASPHRGGGAHGHPGHRRHNAAPFCRRERQLRSGRGDKGAARGRRVHDGQDARRQQLSPRCRRGRQPRGARAPADHTPAGGRGGSPRQRTRRGRPHPSARCVRESRVPRSRRSHPPAPCVRRRRVGDCRREGSGRVCRTIRGLRSGRYCFPTACGTPVCQRWHSHAPDPS
mmetsp:Transcript_14472/g.38136  ORF Transcript_14472/g.38136 Transcript_14472/m.38136 type:complete len:209 (-) Transcript_14472:237-863(-)